MKTLTDRGVRRYIAAAAVVLLTTFGALLFADAQVQIWNGDLDGSTNANKVVTGIKGKPLPPLAVGYLASDGGAWYFSPSAVSPGAAGQAFVMNDAGAAPVWAYLHGDVDASATDPGALTVNAIQGFGVSTSVPSTGNQLAYSSGLWRPSALNLAGGANYVTGTLPTANQAAQTLSGDATGTTAASTVAKINGATVPAAGALTTGNVLQANGASSTTYGPVNLAGGAGYVTGALPTANQVAQSMGGDVTGTTAANTVVGLTGSGGIVTMSAGTIKVTGASLTQTDTGAVARDTFELAHWRITPGGGGTDFKAVLGPDVGLETSAAALWLVGNAVTPSGTNYSIANTASDVYFNAVSASGNVHFQLGTSDMLMLSPTTLFIGGSTYAAPFFANWSVASAPYLYSGTSATSFKLGTNMAGAKLALQQDAAITALTLSGGAAVQAQIPSTATSFTLNWAAASGAGAPTTITGQGAGGAANDGGPVSVGGGAGVGTGVDGSTKITTPLNGGLLQLAPSGNTSLTNAQSDANFAIVNPSVALTVTWQRRIADTSCVWVRNGNGGGITLTVAYLSGGTATVASATSALICSDGANLQKIMSGT